MSLLFSRFRLTLVCISIAANSLVAGGVFVFPVLSPAFAHILKLSQPQLTTVSLAGITGQYPFSPIVGKILDLYGPSRCSIIAAGLFFVAFVWSSSLLAMTPPDTSYPSPWSFRCLTVAFFMAGLGTVFSYFSSIFAASKNFPLHPGAAAGTSMALFGLSPLCLSVIATNWFTEAVSGQLRIVSYLRFLALLTTLTHLFGAFVLDSSKPSTASSLESAQADETTSLLPALPDAVSFSRSHLNPIQDYYFWILAFFTLCSIGASEMVISNMGTIVLSLTSDPLSAINIPSDVVTANQVKILSISNTLSRLVVGPLADFVSPVASYLPTGATIYPRKHRISRVVFLTLPTSLLCMVFLWMEIGAKSRRAVWVLSVGTGINYGAVFAVLPSIVSSGWGTANLGRNFGILSYAPFIGTPIFSYLYAFISAANSDESEICQGTICWRVTFWVATVTSAAAVLGTLILWKHWHGHL
ncbi:putative transporter MCH1 [Termitomyces sp. T112]|nr:putative transporter MCH1 [Termitomyces sp. T112]